MLTKKFVKPNKYVAKVTKMGFEPIRLAAPPPQDGESTNSSTWPKIKKEAKQLLSFFL